jgi:hypothetical protein
MDITSAAIATIISATTSATITLLINKSNYKKELETQLNDILKISLQYPEFENKIFTDQWTSKYDISDKQKLQYEIYATLVFNYLSRFTKFYRYNKTKIENELAIKEWVRIHKKYWYDPTVPNENIDLYDRPFVSLIDYYLSGGNVT